MGFEGREVEIVSVVVVEVVRLVQNEWESRECLVGRRVIFDVGFEGLKVFKVEFVELLGWLSNRKGVVLKATRLKASFITPRTRFQSRADGLK